MSPADFYLVLAFGFVSSLHCVQMCGPIVLTYSVAANSTLRAARCSACTSPTTRAEPSLIACSALPPASLAAACASLAAWPAFENIAAIVAGIAMVLAGLVLLGMSPAFKGWRGLQMPSQLLGPLVASCRRHRPGASSRSAC